MTQNDFDHVDVFAMARATGLRLTLIYDVLRLPYDETTQRLSDAVSTSKNINDFCNSMNALSGWLRENGCNSVGIASPYDPSIDFSNESGSIVFPKGGRKVSHLSAILLSQERVKGGIPWGTPSQIEKISRALKDAKLDQMKELLDQVPHQTPEREQVIRAIAKFFTRPAEP